MKRKPRFDIYRTTDGWRWRLRAANGRIVAQGEAHPNKANVMRAANAVAQAAMGAAQGLWML